MNLRLLTLCTILCLSCHTESLAQTSRPDASDIATQARAILSNRCFACHGPDEESREGGFRLDDPISFLGEADSGETPIVAGAPDGSELFARIQADDESMLMPPPDFGGRLTNEEVDVIRRWIRNGAELPTHWSFQQIRPPAIPEDLPETLTSPIDAFVSRAHAAQDLRFNEPAKRAQLLRRVSLDLIGLPPTLDELDAFLRDSDPGAYERQVDRLLASPAYGEHWARKWLDLARYADSAGYADDPPRTIWAYRDWVIRAINAGMPVDEFTRKQLAGDLLPGATDSDLIATAMHRNTMTNSEGGTDDEEFRNAAVVDRVNTTMAIWMGLTMGCAQCHTHKYDPFTHEEYFQLFAIFNNTADADRKDETPTLDVLTDQQQQRRASLEQEISQIDRSLRSPPLEQSAEFESWLDELQQPTWETLSPINFRADSKSDAEFSASNGVLVRPANANLLKDRYTLSLEIPATDTPVQAVAIETLPAEALGDAAGLASNGNFVVTEVDATYYPASEAARPAKFVRVTLPGKSKILSLAEVEVWNGEKNVAVDGKASQSTTDYAGEASRAIDGNTSGDYSKNSTTHTAQSDSPWWEVELEQAQPIDRITVHNRTDNKLQSRLSGAIVQLLDERRNLIFESDPFKSPGDSKQIVVPTSTGMRFAQALASYEQTDFAARNVIDGDAKTGWAVGGGANRSQRLTLIPNTPLETPSGGRLEITINQQSGYRNHLLGSFRVVASGSQSVRDWSELPSELQQLASKPELAEAQLQRLAAFHFANFSSVTAPLRARKTEVLTALKALKPATSVPIMREVKPADRRETFVQLRGSYLALGDKVEAGFPSALHSGGNKAGGNNGGSNKAESDAANTESAPNRLDLANWIMHPENPLTARVWANRIWEQLFGRGLVATSEEFGSQGELPTHPALLDWLAVELQKSGWNEKRIVREIVLSRTYRQSTTAPKDAIAADPANVWLSRGPGLRLSAEMVRDQALQLGGLLADKMYGPPVRPPQPNLGLKAAFGGSTDWKTSEGEDRYRRGLYTTWRRSNPYPSLATFDAPSREVCTLKRDNTNTPLQALVTLNDPAFVEAAQAFARRIVKIDCGCSDADTTRIRTAFRMATSREPNEFETDTLLKLLNGTREHFASRRAEAEQLATDPLGPLPRGLEPVELASWTAVCNTLLNLDETLMKR